MCGLGDTYVRHRKDWEFIRRLRKIIIKNKDQRNCITCKFCDWFHGMCCIWLGRLFFRCYPYGCYYSRGKVDVKDLWAAFFSKTVSITNQTFNDMKESYGKYNFAHRYYCYKTDGERCSHLDCKHKTLITMGGFLKHPTLYLIELDYLKLKVYKKIISTAKSTRSGTGEEYLESDYLELIFLSVKEGATEKRNLIQNAYEGIKNKLRYKVRYLCLVLVNFPETYESLNDLEQRENFLMAAVLKLYTEFDLQLIYKVR